MRKRRYPACRRRLIGWAAILAILSATATQAQQLVTPSAPSINVLDGKTFTGEIVPVGRSSGRAEDFVFVDGKFYSRVCLDWGFKPGPYWVRLEKGRVHFLARLTSSENGVMTYRGTVVGSKIDAKVEWIKPRWYWTMERQFHFQGNNNENVGKGGS